MNIPYHKPMFFKKERQPEPFRFDFSPTVVEIPGQPKTIDLAISEVANREESPLPKKPRRVVAITNPIAPTVVSVGLLPEKPLEISVISEVGKPSSVSVEATPVQPQVASVIADPIAPLQITANSMPFAPTVASVSATPKKPESASSISDPKEVLEVSVNATPVAPSVALVACSPKKPESASFGSLPYPPSEVVVGNMPYAPTQVSVNANPKKPESASFGYIPHAPTEADADFIPYAPTQVSVNANPKKPESASFGYLPYAPTAISGGIIPDAPSEISVGLVPDPPAEISALGAPAKPSLAYAFEPFVVGIMEPEDTITARPASTPEGTVAFGTDTKKLYVFNKTGIDSWGAFAQDASYKYDQYSIKTDFEYPATTGYFGAVLSKKYATSGAQEFTHSGGIAFSAWFKINEHHNSSHMISLSTGGSYDGGWHQSHWGSNICFKTSSAQNKLSFRMGGVSHSIGDIEYGKWHHLVFSWIGDTVVNSTTNSGPCRVYLDGQTIFDDTKSTNLNFQGSTFPFVINTNSYPTEGWVRNFAGNVSELAVWNHPLTPVEVSDMYYNGVPQLLDLNPTAWWRMGDGSEGASGTAIENVVGDGYQGNIIKHGNEPITLTYEEDTPPPVPYSNRHSLSFDGVDDQVNCGNITSLVSATAFSLSFWFKPVTQGVGASIGMRFNAQNQYAFYNNRFYLYTQPIGTSLAYTPPADTNWHNYAVSYDAGSVSIYIDGEEVASATNFPTTLPIATLQDEFYIGSYGPLTGSYASEGSFDEVALFTTALSASDIASIYNGGTPNNLTALSPEHWWRMGENNSGVGTIIPDMGSGGTDATIIGDASFSTEHPTIN